MVSNAAMANVLASSQYVAALSARQALFVSMMSFAALPGRHAVQEQPRSAARPGFSVTLSQACAAQLGLYCQEGVAVLQAIQFVAAAAVAQAVRASVATNAAVRVRCAARAAVRPGKCARTVSA